jgi:hypothetical protein
VATEGSRLCRRSWRTQVLAAVLPATLLMGLAIDVEAHGTSGKRVEKHSVCLLFAYDEEEPMSHVKATVSAPGSDVPFQFLATDRNGLACFAPDGAGDWLVVVGDGMGHQQTMVIPVAMDNQQVATPQHIQETPPGRDKLSSTFAGIGVIGALTGLFAWYRSRRRGEICTTHPS